MTLTRIFHTDLLRKPGSQMDAALDSHFDLGSRDTYSPASKCSPALPHQPSQPPRRDQYEISGLESTAKNSSDYYDEKMAVNQGMGSLPIYRLGTPGNYSYELLQEGENQQGDKEELAKKPLLFLSIQEAEQFCRWKNLPPTALHPTFPQMDRMLQTTQNSFSLNEEGAASQQAIIEEEAVGTTFDILFEELLGIAVLSAGVSHSYHPREEETFRTRQEHSIIQQNPASSGTPYSPLRSRAGSEEEPAAKRPRLLDPSGLGEESTLGKRSLLITEDFTPSNKSQNRGSSSSSSSIAIQNVTHDQDTTSDMASKVEAAQRTHFRLGENGWEQRDPEATEWQLADPEKLQYKPTGEVRTSKGLDVVFQKYNRANPGDAIDKKKSAYQEELTDLNQSDPSSKRAILLSKLLPLCEQARDYQYKIVGHLLKEKEKREEKKGEVSNKVTSLAVTTLENVIQLNDAPNAVERLITQIEKDDKAHCRSQKLSAEIQLKIAAEIAAGDPSIKLLEAQELINNSVTRYKELIDARIASAKSLKPPYEKEGTQESEHVGTETSGTSEEKKNLYLYEFRARKDYYSAQSILHEEREAVDDNDDSDDDSDENEYNHWEDAVNACNNAINFITNPNIKGIEKVATAYLQAVDYFKKAATAQANGKEKEAGYWSNAGCAYEKIAEEQAKNNPKPAVVENYTQAIIYFKKAATAQANGKEKEALYLNNVGRVYLTLAAK